MQIHDSLDAPYFFEALPWQRGSTARLPRRVAIHGSFMNEVPDLFFCGIFNWSLE